MIFHTWINIFLKQFQHKLNILSPVFLITWHMSVHSGDAVAGKQIVIPYFKCICIYSVKSFFFLQK